MVMKLRDSYTYILSSAQRLESNQENPGRNPGMSIKGTRLAHDAQQGGTHKVPPFFSNLSHVCEPVCGVCFGHARGTVVDPDSGYLVSSGKQRSRRAPKAHECFSSSCAFLLITRCLDITVGSVDLNRYSRYTVCGRKNVARFCSTLHLNSDFNSC